MTHSHKPTTGLIHRIRQGKRTSSGVKEIRTKGMSERKYADEKPICGGSLIALEERLRKIGQPIT